MRLPPEILPLLSRSIAERDRSRSLSICRVAAQGSGRDAGTGARVALARLAMSRDRCAKSSVLTSGDARPARTFQAPAFVWLKPGKHVRLLLIVSFLTVSPVRHLQTCPGHWRRLRSGKTGVRFLTK